MTKNLVVCIIFLLHHTVYSQNKTYYINTTGNDANNGLSMFTAWQTLSRINTLDLEPGDQILLEGGASFTGSIQLDQNDSGTPANPVLISSYGTGRATIYAPNTVALHAFNVGGVKLANLIFQGNNKNKNGIHFEIDQTSTDLDFISIDNIDVFNFSGRGLFIEARSTDKGFNDVTVVHSNFHNNGLAGMETMGNTPMFSHTNFSITYCRFYDNYGTLDVSRTSGNGLVISGVDGATISYCESNNNGSNNRRPDAGPVGIWMYEAKNVTIQNCESHHNQAGSYKDGGGFDIDGGSQDCIIQYCYSHDNEGAGYLMAEYGSPNEFKNNIIRYNVSQNDGRNNSYGAVTLYAVNQEHQIKNCRIYNNTLYVNNLDVIGGTPSAVNVFSQNFLNVQLSNNIFYVTSGVDLINCVASQTTSEILFLNNNYYSVTSDYRFKWNSTYYTSLADWRFATGQEMDGTNLRGIAGDPLLINAGSGGTVNPADGGSLNFLFGYTLNSTSPVINEGIDLSNMGTHDFFGNAIPQFSNYDIGASEYVGSTPLPLTISDFVAVVQTNNVVLRWKVYNEHGIQKYEVLKSNNGIQFNKVGTITPVHTKAYTFTDSEKPVNAFYRIKYVFADGSSGMSSTLKVLSTERKDMLAFYNDGQGLQLRLWSDQKSVASIYIYNAAGALLATSQNQLEKGGNNLMVAGSSQLKPGVYFINVTQSGNTSKVLKFVKPF